MAASTLLLVAPPSAERDEFSRAFRKHGMRIITRDDCTSARKVLESTPVHSVFMAHLMIDPALDTFLLQMRARHPNVPLLFAGSWDPYKIVQLVGQHMVLLLPPGVLAEAVEKFFFPEPAFDPRFAPAPLQDDSAMCVRKDRYSLNLRQARLEFEAEFLYRALEREKGNVTKTANAIGIARRLLQMKIQTYKINLGVFRNDDSAGLQPA